MSILKALKISFLIELLTMSDIKSLSPQGRNSLGYFSTVRER